MSVLGTSPGIGGTFRLRLRHGPALRCKGRGQPSVVDLVQIQAQPEERELVAETRPPAGACGYQVE